jgi:hypothetical protein
MPLCLFLKTKSGKPSKKLQVKRNRSKNVMTMGLEACIVALEKKGTSIPQAVKKNLEALTEIRDNAIHYLNALSWLSRSSR